MPLNAEGTEVSRPVIAMDMGNNMFKILGTAQGLTPEELDEEWLFPIGSYVKCKTLQRPVGIILIASELHKS